MKRFQSIWLTSIIAVVSMMGCQGTKGTSCCEGRSDDFACSNLDVAVSFDMPSEVRNSSLALKEIAGNTAPRLHAGVSDDGLMLPIGKDSNYTNADVIVYMVNVKNDASAPREKFAYPFQKEFLNDYVQNYYTIKRGGYHFLLQKSDINLENTGV